MNKIKKLKKVFPLSLALPLLMAASGCQSGPYRMPKEVASQVVDSVDIERFMGDWHVIASIPTPFEKGVHNGLESYRWNEKEKIVEVSFTYRKGSFDGEKKEITQKGFIQDPVGRAHWLVQPIWPLKFGYIVVDLDPEYRWTTVGVPDKSYVWIMARSHEMSDSDYQQATKRLEMLGYDMSKLKKVPQNGQLP
jgi:apolipoprotein D and lipocalin family protein